MITKTLHEATIIDGFELHVNRSRYGLVTIRTNPMPRTPPNTEGLRIMNLTAPMWEWVVETLRPPPVSQPERCSAVMRSAGGDTLPCQLDEGHLGSHQSTYSVTRTASWFS